MTIGTARARRRLFVGLWCGRPLGQILAFDMTAQLVFSHSSGCHHDLEVRDINGDGAIDLAYSVNGHGTGISEDWRFIHFSADLEHVAPTRFPLAGYLSVGFQVDHRTGRTFTLTDPKTLEESHLEQVFRTHLVFDHPNGQVPPAARVYLLETFGDKTGPNAHWIGVELRRQLGVGIGEVRRTLMERWSWDGRVGRYRQVVLAGQGFGEP